MFDSDSELTDYVRTQVGVSRGRDLPDEVLTDELTRAKSELTNEVEERIRTGDGIGFFSDNADQKALMYYVLVRARLHVLESQGNLPENVGKAGPPDSVSSMRRMDFGDDTLNHWGGRMVTYLNKMTE